MSELFTLEYCKRITEKARGMSESVKDESVQDWADRMTQETGITGISYVVTNDAYNVPSSIPADIPRLSDPFRDPKLSWMRSK